MTCLGSLSKAGGGAGIQAQVCQPPICIFQLCLWQPLPGMSQAQSQARRKCVCSQKIHHRRPKCG